MDKESKARAPGVRVRPLPELECLLAFSPVTRTLHWLNLTAWAIFELCDGTRSGDELIREYAQAIEGLLSVDEVARQVTAGLESLEKIGLITTQSPDPPIGP